MASPFSFRFFERGLAGAMWGFADIGPGSFKLLFSKPNEQPDNNSSMHTQGKRSVGPASKASDNQGSLVAREEWEQQTTKGTHPSASGKRGGPREPSEVPAAATLAPKPSSTLLSPGSIRPGRRDRGTGPRTASWLRFPHPKPGRPKPRPRRPELGERLRAARRCGLAASSEAP